MKTAVADLCRLLSLGVSVVGACHDHRQDAFTASSVIKASFEPPLLVISIH